MTLSPVKMCTQNSECPVGYMCNLDLSDEIKEVPDLFQELIYHDYCFGLIAVFTMLLFGEISPKCLHDQIFLPPFTPKLTMLARVCFTCDAFKMHSYCPQDRSRQRH